MNDIDPRAKKPADEEKGGRRSVPPSVDSREVGGWILFGVALLYWGIMFGYGAWDRYHVRSGFFPGLGGALLMTLFAPAAILPAIIGGLVGRHWARAANVWLIVVVVVAASGLAD